MEQFWTLRKVKRCFSVKDKHHTFLTASWPKSVFFLLSKWWPPQLVGAWWLTHLSQWLHALGSSRWRDEVMNGRKQKATVSSATLWQRRNTAMLVGAAPWNWRLFQRYYKINNVYRFIICISSLLESQVELINKNCKYSACIHTKKHITLLIKNGCFWMWAKKWE